MTRSAISKRLLALGAACGSLVIGAVPLASGPVAAQSQPGAFDARLNIAPLRIDLEGSQTAQVVRLTNTSQRELAVQSRLFAWSQVDGEDTYAPSSDIAISPSIVTIPPGKTQIVRLLRKAPASQGEKRFRLAVDQLPDPTAAATGQAEARIRFTLPVFLDRDLAAPAQLDWRLTPDAIVANNVGGATSRIVKIEVAGADGRVVEVERNTLRYIHGNSTIAWPIGGGCANGTVTVTAIVDGQQVDVEPTRLCT